MDDTVAFKGPGPGRAKGSKNKPYDRLFRHSDVTRAIKAGKAAGFGKFKVDIDKSGKISLVPMESGDQADARGASEWDNPEKWDRLAQDDPEK